MAKRTWKLVLRDYVLKDANILRARLVLSLKDTKMRYPTFKAHFAVQGHRDKEKTAPVHDTTNMRQPSIKIVTAIAVIFGFHLWSTYISQAYLQSWMGLLREAYNRPTGDIELPPGTLLKLLRPLYGLLDAGVYWHATFSRHMQRVLRMNHTYRDLALFFKHIKGQRMGLAGTYVDDSILSRTTQFRELNENTGQNCESHTAAKANFAF